MKRDFVCVARLIIDSFPDKIRNSKFLFLILRLTLRVPKYFYNFRKEYKTKKINLTQLYKNPKYSSRRISKNTDINSFHQKDILDYIKETKPKSILDLGSGTGFMLRKIKRSFQEISLTGVDLSVEKNDLDINYIESSIDNFFKKNSSLNFDLIICCHTLEHIENPSEIVKSIKNHSNNSYILICPLEKRFEWGLNYHINFFESIDNFVYSLNLKKEGAKIKVALGDIFYSNNL